MKNNENDENHENAQNSKMEKIQISDLFFAANAQPLKTFVDVVLMLIPLFHAFMLIDT